MKNFIDIISFCGLLAPIFVGGILFILLVQSSINVHRNWLNEAVYAAKGRGRKLHIEMKRREYHVYEVNEEGDLFLQFAGEMDTKARRFFKENGHYYEGGVYKLSDFEDLCV